MHPIQARALELRRRFYSAPIARKPHQACEITKPDPDPALSAFREIATPKDARRKIEREVADRHGLHPAAFMLDRRSKKIVDAKAELFHRLNIELGFSLARIGMLYGRDHTSVLNLVKRFRGLINIDQ